MTSYSFIKPQKKPIFSLFSKIWMLFISTVVLLFAAVNLFVELKSGSLRNETQISKQKQDQIKEQIKQTDELTALLKQRRDSANEILASNAVLKQSVRNLLDLVPSSITLNEIAMDKNSFYLLDCGCLIFISTNKTDSLEGKNE